MTPDDKEKEKKLKVKAGAKTRTIQVDYLARVEGEGAMFIKTKEGKVTDVELRIFEPPRFFEALLRGRELFDAPDITARICGICPVAYQMSSVNAMENALGVTMPRHIHELRRLLYCGEWIESHTLHMLMLHAPDFLGYMDVIAMSKDHPDIIKRGLKLKKAGNELIQLLAGREIHPINVKVGGFYKLPEKNHLRTLIDPLKEARDDAIALVEWFNTFEFPDLVREYECVCLVPDDEYPMAAGPIGSTSGLNISPDEYDDHFKEEHVERSTSLHSTMTGGKTYITGPMARWNLRGHLLPEIVKQAAASIGFEKEVNNPFRMLLLRALEVVYACDEALRVIEEYDSEKAAPSVPLTKRAATGYGATEAPRGLLYHRYRLDEKGLIEDAKIVAPTSQNQRVIEEDLFDFVSQNIDLPDNELTWKSEQTIRNYDPCISCSAHFLKMERVDG